MAHQTPTRGGVMLQVRVDDSSRDRIRRTEVRPAMKTNARIRKELLSLAGEHRVASELCKLGVFATITPGNRKQTDMYVINDTRKRFLRIEVKASQTKSFVTRYSQRKLAGANPPDFWVLVHFNQGSERFFVLENGEIEKLQQEVNDKWLEGFRRRHAGNEFDVRKGVDRLSLDVVEEANCENCWPKIVAAVGGAEA
jgi:hypothetical protein